MPLLIPKLDDNESFEYKEEPIEEEEQHDEEFGGVLTYIPPYPDSSSYEDRAETQDEDPTDLESSLEIVAPLPPSLIQSFISRPSGPRNITTPRKTIHSIP